MTSLRAMTGRDLRWVRPKLLKRMYELRSEDTVVAEMSFDHPFAWTALGKVEEGSWTFERSGFLRSRIAVKHSETGTEVASISERPGRRKQQILLPQGPPYMLCSDFFRTRFALQTESQEDMALVRRRGIFKPEWELEIRYSARSNQDLPLLVLLTWYYILIVRTRQRRR